MPSGAVERSTVRALDGPTFCVSDTRGDVDAGPGQAHGLFHRDTRYLSRWSVQVDGKAPDALSSFEPSYFSAYFFLSARLGDGTDKASISVIRKRFVGAGLHEDLILVSHDAESIDVELRVLVGSDFADVFEVKEDRPKKGELYQEVRDGTLVLGYRRDGWRRETWIESSERPSIDGEGFTFRVTLAPRSQWQTCLVATIVARERPEIVKYGHGERTARPDMAETLERWLEEAPTLQTDWDPLTHIYERSLVDLAALRFYPLVAPDASLPAAGLPWFMALFGRDSLLTSYQTLPFVPELAKTTLRVLAARQAEDYDDFRDAEPGKILHELRFGELTHFRERPQSPYYGTADATPLFLILLDEYERWTGDDALVREMEPNARAALEWVDRDGDFDGDGYVEYRSRNPKSGLENHCWKDSWNSMQFADGTLARVPIAACEIQGYVYDAKIRTARLARAIWRDPELADRLEREASELRRRFDEDFWLEEREFFALALDADKRQVDSVTSNVGHLLWSGLVEEHRVQRIADELMGARLFSGWGVRTLADSERGYDPVGYHIGTVWPHDNGLIAAGLARYGYRDEAARIAIALLEAAVEFSYRLPEAFAGYARDFTIFPVEYPTACSPQAWATGTPLLLLRLLLGLEPGKTLASDPALPEEIGELELSGVRWRSGSANVVAR